jgi:hypothetical protein
LSHITTGYFLSLPIFSLAEIIMYTPEHWTLKSSVGRQNTKQTLMTMVLLLDALNSGQQYKCVQSNNKRKHSSHKITEQHSLSYQHFSSVTKISQQSQLLLYWVKIHSK